MTSIAWRMLHVPIIDIGTLMNGRLAEQLDGQLT